MEEYNRLGGDTISSITLCFFNSTYTLKNHIIYKNRREIIPQQLFQDRIGIDAIRLSNGLIIPIDQNIVF
jgi:hypothetical protein